MFSCLQTLPACEHFFETKARFYHFFLHQTQSKHVGNVRKKAWQTLFIVRLVLDAQARPSAQEVGWRDGLAASYIRTSTDSNSSLLSSRIWISSDRNRFGPDSFSLINPQQSVRCTERDRTTSKIPVQLMLLQV